VVNEFTVHNVTKIFDNDEFVSIKTVSNTWIHLPRQCKHAVFVMNENDPSDHDTNCVNIRVCLNEGE